MTAKKRWERGSLTAFALLVLIAVGLGYGPFDRYCADFARVRLALIGFNSNNRPSDGTVDTEIHRARNAAESLVEAGDLNFPGFFQSKLEIIRTTQQDAYTAALLLAKKSNEQDKLKCNYLAMDLRLPSPFPQLYKKAVAIRKANAAKIKSAPVNLGIPTNNVVN